MLNIADGTSNTILFGERTYGTTSANMAYWLNTIFTGGTPGMVDAIGDWTGLLGITPSTWGTAWCDGSIALNYSYPPPSGDAFASIVAMKTGYRSFHPGGADFTFCDGSVHFINDSINNAGLTQTNIGNGIYYSSYNGPISILGALCTRAGGEVVDPTQY